MESSNENSELLTQLQSLEFELNSQTLSPSEQIQKLRNILFTFKRTDTLTEEESHLVSHKFAKLYSDIVDYMDETKGMNNFAEGALALCSRYNNESSQWQSSFTNEYFQTLDCVKKAKEQEEIIRNNNKVYFRRNTKPSSSTVFQNQKSHTIFQDGSSNSNNPYSLKGCDTVNPSLRDQRNPSALMTKPVQFQNNAAEIYSGGPNPGIKRNWSSREIDFQGHKGTENVGYNRKPFFGNEGGDQPFNAYGKKRNDTDVNLGNYKCPVQEKPNRLEEEDSRPSYAGAFKTARQQMHIDNQKKYGGGRGGGGSGNNQPYTSSYGQGKKSLGPRRGTSSKFVPPVMNRDEDDDGVNMDAVARAVIGRSSKDSSSKSSEEPTDERLKGIEPKMIELIMNEIMDHGPHINWDDIAGLEFAKKCIKEIVVWPMLRPDIFTGLRGPPKGLLLFGPPGTGKTLIGKCIAHQSKSTFFSISASSLTSKWVGEGEKMVRALFAVARVHQPAVVFIDEIDSLLSQRSDGEHEASRRIKTEFLIQLDGAGTSSDERILVIGATNRPQEIDEAARRRFVKRLYIPLPEEHARQQIVVNLLQQQKYHLTEDQLLTIAQRAEGYSGADMASLCREAALGPIRSMPFDEIENISADQVRPILFQDFVDAFGQVKASVSEKDLQLYIDWNNTFGSSAAPK